MKKKWEFFNFDIFKVQTRFNLLSKTTFQVENRNILSTNYRVYRPKQHYPSDIGHHCKINIEYIHRSSAQNIKRTHKICRIL